VEEGVTKEILIKKIGIINIKSVRALVYENNILKYEVYLLDRAYTQ
jgi:hypothetical protein